MKVFVFTGIGLVNITKGVEYRGMKERNIVFITDDNYVMPTIVTIQSLISTLEVENNYRYVINICALDLADDNVEKFVKMQTNNISIKVIQQFREDYIESFKLVSQNSHVTPTALLKFELPNIFNKVDYILYLDSVIIVKKSLHKLFDYNIENYYAAASFEYWKYLLEVYKYKGEPQIPEFYFNSGVMLLNLKKMREENIVDLLWNTKIQKYNNKDTKAFALMDQDVFNEVFKDKVLPLSIIYNFNCRFTEKVDINSINKIYAENYGGLTELFLDAVVIHYVGKEDKPWRYETALCRELWDEYYKLSCYSGQKLERRKPERNLFYYFNAVKQSWKARGLIGTYKYILKKWIE